MWDYGNLERYGYEPYIDLSDSIDSIWFIKFLIQIKEQYFRLNRTNELYMYTYRVFKA